MRRPSGRRWDVIFEWCFIFAPDTDIEGDIKEERRLGEGNLGGHGPKMGRSTIKKLKKKVKENKTKMQCGKCSVLCHVLLIFSGVARAPADQGQRGPQTYLLTYLLHGAESFLTKLTGLQLVKKFPAFHGTRRFFTALTSVRQLPLSWTSPIQSIYPHPTSWWFVLILSTHLRLTYRIPTFVAGSFGLDSILPTGRDILCPCFR